MDFPYNIKLRVNILRATKTESVLCLLQNSNRFLQVQKSSRFLQGHKVQILSRFLQGTKIESIFSKQATKTESICIGKSTH